MGYEILLPLGDRKPYDLAVDIDGKIYKVQVKYAGISTDGKCKASLRMVGGNKTRLSWMAYQEGDFDFLFVYSERGMKYLIPWGELKVVSNLTIESKRYQKFVL